MYSIDLYTFSLRFELDRGPFTLALSENAFTDRGAGTRFDETYLTVGRQLPISDVWETYAAAGVLRVGRDRFHPQPTRPRPAS